MSKDFGLAKQGQCRHYNVLHELTRVLKDLEKYHKNIILKSYISQAFLNRSGLVPSNFAKLMSPECLCCRIQKTSLKIENTRKQLTFWLYPSIVLAALLRPEASFSMASVPKLLSASTLALSWSRSDSDSPKRKKNLVNDHSILCNNIVRGVINGKADEAVQIYITLICDRKSIFVLLRHNFTNWYELFQHRHVFVRGAVFKYVYVLLF